MPSRKDNILRMFVRVRNDFFVCNVIGLTQTASYG